MAAKMTGTTDLRYLDAHSVRCCRGSLSDFRVCTEDAQPLGTVEGVVISPSSRRLAYLVVESPGFLVHRRYLLSLEACPVVQEDPLTLRITARRDELDLESFTPRSIPALDEEELVTTMFARDVAAPA